LPGLPAVAQGSDIAVVVHPGVSTDNLSLADLRRILTGDREFWPGGDRVAIVIRAPVARERDVVVKDICEMTEAQFRQHWIGKVFRADVPSAPKIAYSNESTLEQVARTPGAIGFVQGPVTSKGVKVIRIDGRAPGQSGYRLR
jgi:ABC-type phosphate transport system substrate-binding protein